jgi:Ribbon-helix-helix protein, copG family
MPQANVEARLARLCPEQWAALDALADGSGDSVAYHLRRAVAEYTHVPDRARSHKRRTRRGGT